MADWVSAQLLGCPQTRYSCEAERHCALDSIEGESLVEECREPCPLCRSYGPIDRVITISSPFRLALFGCSISLFQSVFNRHLLQACDALLALSETAGAKRGRLLCAFIFYCKGPRSPTLSELPV